MTSALAKLDWVEISDRNAGAIKLTPIEALIVEGTHEGLAAARARGRRLGRPPAMTPEQIRHARDLLTRPENTVSSIARLLGVSRSTIFKYVPELATGRSAVERPAQAELEVGS
ncbi:helix-turn-helix domain-containing protein [Nonomuraea sp. NPDC050680]|uniref:helix-turn-helix domain-containing protein n=1 Tax=Nonomuraea sp. NPDC050680 TaxID=3154630 RepID=UPI0033CED384